MLEASAAGLGHRRHHAVRADRDDAVDLAERKLDRPERAGTIGLDRLHDIADKPHVLRSAWRETGRLVAAPHDAVGGALNIGYLVAVFDLLVAGEVEDARALGPERRA